MATLQWAAPSSAQTALTTELNSLANGSTSALGSAWDNTSSRYVQAAGEVYLGSLTPTAGGYVQVYLVPSPDGTNYGDIVNANLVAKIYPSTSTGAKRLTFENVPLGPFLYKVALLNQCGVTLASSGNTVKLWGMKTEAV